VADTRNTDGPFGGPEMAGGTTRSFAIPASGCNVPSTAAAYSVNVTVVPDGALGYLSAWPAGASQPNVSTLNSWDGSVVANAAIIPAGTNAAVSVFVTNNTNVILDINGYFASSNGGSPAGSLVAERALAQTGLSVGLAHIVLQSQMQMLFGGLISGRGAACTPLAGGGSVMPTLGTGADTAAVYYDANCTQPYIVAQVTGASQLAPGGISISETATYDGLNGTNLGTMTLNVNLVMNQDGEGDLTDIVTYGLGSFTPAAGLRTPVQLGLYCDVGENATNCAGAVAQDFPALNLAIGTVTNLTMAGASVVATGPMTFTGSGSTVTGPIGSLTATNPSPDWFVIQGGASYASTTDAGSAAASGLFSSLPTWTLSDAAHDEQFQASVLNSTTRTLKLAITQLSTGNTLATGTVDRSGTGTITYSDGSIAAITNWTVAD
jgi:hypothetical protein